MKTALQRGITIIPILTTLVLMFVSASQSSSSKKGRGRHTTPSGNSIRLWITPIINPSSFHDPPAVGGNEHPQRIHLHFPGKISGQIHDEKKAETHH